MSNRANWYAWQLGTTSIESLAQFKMEQNVIGANMTSALKESAW